MLFGKQLDKDKVWFLAMMDVRGISESEAVQLITNTATLLKYNYDDSVRFIVLPTVESETTIKLLYSPTNNYSEEQATEILETLKKLEYELGKND